MRNFGTAPLLFAAIVILSNIFVGSSQRCKICGIFKLTSDPKDPALQEVWTAMGYSEESRKLIQESTNLAFEIKKNASRICIEEVDNKCSKSRTLNSFTPGSEFQFRLCDGREIPAVAEVNEDDRKISLTLRFPDFEGKKIIELEGKNLVQKYTAKAKKGEEKFVEIEGGEKLGGTTLTDKLKRLNKPKSGKGDKEEKSILSIGLIPMEFDDGS